ncbi:galene [Carabus blaptoides fortunei]
MAPGVETYPVIAIVRTDTDGFRASNDSVCGPSHLLMHRCRRILCLGELEVPRCDILLFHHIIDDRIWDMIPGTKFPSADSYGHFQIVACCAYLLLGLVLVAMSFSLVHDEVIAKSRQLAKAIGIVRH